MSHKRKPLNLIAVVFLISSIFAADVLAQEDQDASAQPAKKSQITALFGYYSMKGVSKSIAAPGSLTLAYVFSFTRKWSAAVSYNNLMNLSGFSTIISGFDFGANYCFGSCVAETRSFGDVMSMTQSNPWGVRVGLGLSQRSFQLASSTVGFSGLFERIEGNYYFKKNWKWLFGIQNSTIVNAGNSINYFSASGGIGIDFGSGPGDWIGKFFN